MTSPTSEDRTPVIESEALKKKLSGLIVSASTYPNGREVPVRFVSPDMQLRNAAYPGIYLSYAGVSKASDREHRGPVALQYAPPGFDEKVLVPSDPDDPDSVPEEWGASYDPRTSPYRVQDMPIPYNLDFNITVLTRNYQEMFQIISQLQEIDRIPARFGGLEVPEDGTVRTLDLLGGPETGAIRDEDGKRILQSVYSVRVAAELSLYEVQQVQRVVSVNLDLIPMTTAYL